MTSPKSRNGIRLADTSELPLTVEGEACRAPFMPRAVNFRVIRSWADGDSKALTHAVCIAYIDARTVMDRLNLVYPGRWSAAFEHNAQTVTCFLTVDGVTHEDIGEGYHHRKDLISDALKRAAVHVGIGRSLYAVPKVLLERPTLASEDGDGLSEVFLRPWREQVNGEWRDTLRLTLDGERACRMRYRHWLLRTGVRAFGPPIDHGDIADCPGMVELGEPAPSAPSKRSGSRSRARATPEPIAADTAEQALADLLARPDDLRGERIACDAAMAAHGLTAASRLDALRSARDAKGLDDLLMEHGTPAPGDVRTDPPIEHEGDTTE